MVGIDRIDGGTNTARLSAAEQDRIAREQRQAHALAYLRRRGLDGPGDIAEILGLIEPAKPRRQRPARTTANPGQARS
ncbi:hypothetical protein QTQ03_25460 [Micromonospora sp. WMMA1363]|uniref:hypothetical protein n=1 Tax=Micromonospora sp. WMMA1363 TaxID=3053985 RepID=UPI00259CDACB|nr:hypothetical protein [Micromonospora sp. WMMA1363]MDM4721126.1 hypothetical protein [Micromonospora sp. WMMA1363]MDM4722784.1 hypothetical protein [Micromonospora sp. WMMA1363]